MNAAGDIGVLARALDRLIVDLRRTEAFRQDRESRRRITDLPLQAGLGPESPLRAAAHAAADPVVVTSAKGGIVIWNPAAERLYGYRADEVLGGSPEIIVPPDLREDAAALMDRLAADERIANHDTARLAKDGRRLPVSLGLSLVRSPAGEVVGVAQLTRDNSAYTTAEERFRLAVEACPSGMIMADRDGRIVLVNGETERLFGYARQQLVGRPVDLLLQADPQGARDGGPQPNDPGGRRECQALRKDGTAFPAEVSFTSIPARDGQLTLSVVIDLTERRRAERLKDEFVSVVSHELRTPLTSISASLALLSSGAAGPFSESAGRLLAIAHNNSRRLVRLINDILDIEKMESGEIAFEIAPVALRPLLEQVIESNREFAESASVRLRLDRAAAVDVLADPDRLVQVFTNLISNAVKFSPPGAEVLLRVKQGPRVRVSVRDFGPGIPEAFKPRIFEKFSQADGDARQKGGSGLGLSIVRQIMARLDGRIWFEDAPGGGTVFHVELPRPATTRPLRAGPKAVLRLPARPPGHEAPDAPIRSEEPRPT